MPRSVSCRLQLRRVMLGRCRTTPGDRHEDDRAELRPDPRHAPDVADRLRDLRHRPVLRGHYLWLGLGRRGATSIPGMAQMLHDQQQYAPDQKPDHVLQIRVREAWAMDQISSRPPRTATFSKRDQRGLEPGRHAEVRRPRRRLQVREVGERPQPAAGLDDRKIASASRSACRSSPTTPRRRRRSQVQEVTVLFGA